MQKMIFIVLLVLVLLFLASQFTNVGSFLVATKNTCQALDQLNVGATSVDVSAPNVTYPWGFPTGGLGAQPPAGWQGSVTLNFDYSLPQGAAPTVLLLDPASKRVVATGPTLQANQQHCSWTTATSGYPSALWIGIQSAASGNNNYSFTPINSMLCFN